MTNDKLEHFLDAALKRGTKASPVDQATVDRVLKRLEGPLPRQRAALWRWPAVLLDWQFAPAWPRVATLAGCAVLGFYIGIVGLDRGFDRLDQPFAAADLGAMVFEPEPLTGARP